MWRELRNFTNVVLPGKGHLSAVMKDFIPQQYIDAMVAFITASNPEVVITGARLWTFWCSDTRNSTLVRVVQANRPA